MTTSPVGKIPKEPDQAPLSKEQPKTSGEMSGRKVSTKAEISQRIFDVVEKAYQSGAAYGESPLEGSLGLYMGSRSSDNTKLRNLQSTDYEHLSKEETTANLNKIEQLIKKGFDQLDKELRTRGNTTPSIYEKAKTQLLQDVSEIRKDV